MRRHPTLFTENEHVVPEDSGINAFSSAPNEEHEEKQSGSHAHTAVKERFELFWGCMSRCVAGCGLRRRIDLFPKG